MQGFCYFTVTLIVTHLQDFDCDAFRVRLIILILVEEVFAPRRVSAMVFGVAKMFIVPEAHHASSFSYVRLLAERARQLIDDASGVAPALEARGAGVAARGPPWQVQDSLHRYLQHINHAHSSISFTIETTGDSGSIPFLDTTITVKPNGKYITELYIKPTSAGIILHAESAQPWKTKRAVLHSQIRRSHSAIQ